MTTEGELLQQRAESGDPEAQMTLAMLLDKRGMHEHAVNWLRTASQNGYGPAQYVLGARLIVGRAAPFEPEEGAQWVSAAAQGGMPEALALMSVLAATTDEWTQAVNFAKAAAAAGDDRSAEVVGLLGDPRRFDAGRWDQPCDVHWESQAPRIGVIRDFIPAAFCDWIVRRAQPKLETARVKNPADGRGAQADYRTNSGAGFSLLDTDLILQMVHARIAAVTEIPIENQEPTNVLHYNPNEEYKAHFDFITPSAANEAELAVTGQRSATVLIYLNDGYEGGETDFPNLKWKFKGKRGDALMFWNLDAEGAPDRRTLHAGLPLKRGEKWLLSKWIRERPYPVV